MGSRPLPPALTLLSGEKNRAADAALLEALPHMAAHARTAAVEMMFRRADEPTLAALVLRFGAYDQDLKNLISRRIGALHAPTRAAIASEQLEERAGAIDLIRLSVETKLAYLLADAVRSPCERTRELAAQALYDMAALVCAEPNADPPPRTAWSDQQPSALAEALATAVQRWDVHFQPKVLEAALWMGDRTEEAILAKIKDPHSKITSALGAIIENSSDPRLAGAVLRFLAVPAIRPAATRALSAVRNPSFMYAVARKCWLLADPEIEHGCRSVHEGRWLDDWQAAVRQLPEPQAANAIRILGAVGGASEKKMERFRVLLDAHGDELRRAVLWQVIGDKSAPASDFITMIATRSGDAISEIAARECRRRHPEMIGAAGKGGAELRGEGDADPFEALFETFDRLTSVERESAAQRMKEMDARIAEKVRPKCASPNPIERCRALRIAQTLGVMGELAEEVYKLAHDHESVVRGAAVRALMQLPGPTTTRILRIAINDADARVQANAIEALDRLNVDDRLSYIKDKLSSPHNRVRANAVRALLRLEICEAGEVLLDMLEDSSETHRLSALWVVERMRLRSVLNRVFDMSRNDPDERVRQRARRVLPDLDLKTPRRSPKPRFLAGDRSTEQLGSS